MKTELTTSICKYCKNSIETKDPKWGKRITCPYSPNKEFLGDYCNEKLNEICGHYKVKTVQGVRLDDGKVEK